MPPIARTTQIPQRISPGGTRRQRTTSSSESDRSPNLTMRGSYSDPLGQKKLGTRVSCLETQLLQAQQELKNLKQHLSSAKKEDQSDLPKKTKKNPPTKDQVEEETNKEMDVFEVPMQDSIESNEKDSKTSEIEQLKADLEAKEKELESAFQEREILKKQLNEATEEISAIHNKEEETILKCTQIVKDLEASKAANFELNEKVETLEASKEEMEVEMKKLRIQTEQWRKAADAAASVLAGGANVDDVVRISGRRGAMDKHFNGVFEPPFTSGIPGFLGSEAVDDMDDGKIKVSGGIRMFGDLWKKKGQK